jgi:hypothetical protein
MYVTSVNKCACWSPLASLYFYNGPHNVRCKGRILCTRVAHALIDPGDVYLRFYEKKTVNGNHSETPECIVKPAFSIIKIIFNIILLHMPTFSANLCSLISTKDTVQILTFHACYKPNLSHFPTRHYLNNNGQGAQIMSLS